MKEVVLSIGSNIGNRVDNLWCAVRALNLLPSTTVVAVSKNYETEPFGVDIPQPKFLNCCVRMLTSLSPEALLGACLGIEASMGRIRVVPNSPRYIDIDVILYEGVQRETQELTIPHPRWEERAFVLLPLSEICENNSVMGIDFSTALEQCDKTGVAPAFSR